MLKTKQLSDLEGAAEDLKNKAMILQTGIDLQALLRLLVDKGIISREEIREYRNEVSGSPKWGAAVSFIEQAKAETEKPSIIICRTQIGYGCPAKQGKASAHGEPLGAENLAEAKKTLGWDYAPFEIPQDVYDCMAENAARGAQAQKDWEAMMQKYAAEDPTEYAEYQQWMNREFPVDLMKDEDFWKSEGKPNATRASSGTMLNRIAAMQPNLFGGSADLAPSNKSLMKDREYYSPANRAGSNFHFGIREHAMAAICNGLYLHGGVTPYCATFFVFSDYMKNAMRMSALMKLPVIYILTHDSIGVGEDGPTHEPIEHLASLRSIPGLTVIRPADDKETAAAYCAAVTRKSPTALILTRQNLPQYENSGKEALKGAYILKDSVKAVPDVILMASGSEVEQIFKASEMLAEQGVDARVVSMPSWEIFEEQSAEYKESVLPNAVRARVAIEAASSFGWAKYVGLDGEIISIDHFGASAPASVLFREFGITAEHVVQAALRVVKK